MKDDDILKQFFSGFGVLGGGYLFLYLVIIGTQHPPVGYALKFVRAFETTARWLLFIIVVVAVLFFMLAIAGHFKNKRQKDCERLARIKQEEERKRLRAIAAQEEAKHNRIKLEQEKLAIELRQQELEQRQTKKETYLKNRSAEDATKDALRDFM